MPTNIRTTRKFNAETGYPSIGDAGCDSLEIDLDNLYANKVWASEVLKTNNTTAYTPTGNYNPATKIYVDNKLGDIATILNYING